MSNDWFNCYIRMKISSYIVCWTVLINKKEKGTFVRLFLSLSLCILGGEGVVRMVKEGLPWATNHQLYSINSYCSYLAPWTCWFVNRLQYWQKVVPFLLPITIQILVMCFCRCPRSFHFLSLSVRTEIPSDTDYKDRWTLHTNSVTWQPLSPLHA